MEEIRLRGQAEPVRLDDVTDSGSVITGTNKAGKRFVARKERLREGDLFELLPNDAGVTPVEQHPYRIYVEGGYLARVVAPSFAEAEGWLADGDGATSEQGALVALLEDGRVLRVERQNVLSILSARPEDAGGDPTEASPDEEPVPA